MSNIISRRKPAEEEEGTANSHSPPHSPPNSTPHSPSHSPSHSPPHSPSHSTLRSPRHSPIPEDAPPPTQSQYTPRTATPLKSAMATYGSAKKKRVTISPNTSNCIDDDEALPLPHPVGNENSDDHDSTDEEGEEEEPLVTTAAEDATSAVPEPSELVSKVTTNGSGSASGGACTDNVRVEADEGLGEEAGREPSSIAGEEGDQQDVDVGGVAIGNTSTPDQQEGTLDKMSENAVGSSPSGRFLKFDIEVGRGSFKTVYRGLDTETGVAVAWCELSTHKMTKNDRAKFLEEGKMLKILEHRNILGFYDYWEVPEKRKVILVTELMTSGTLKAYMRRLKDVKIKFIRTWGRQILQGLHYLHTSKPPIIHRDLKCDNIFINGTTGLVKIGDLGLATLKVSHVKTVIGTPEFMAPEMYEEHYDESVDVYAFGMCLVEMSTLEYPYQECSNPAQVYKKVTAGIPPLSLEKVRNQALKDIALKCTKQHKEDRYTVQELLENPFFQLADYKIEVLPPDEPLDKGSNIISLRIEPQRLKLPDMEEGAATAFECTYDLQNDVPEDIAQDLVLQGIISSEDTAEVSKLIDKKVAQKREQEGDPAVAAQHTATDEKEAQAESVTIPSPHIGQQESGSAQTTAHSQQESPAVAKVDDAAVSKGEESHLRSPPLDDPPVGPPNGEPEPTPPSSAPPSSSSSPDNPPNTSSEAQQGPAPQPPPALTSQMSDGPEELTVSRTSSKPSKVVPHPQEEAGGAVEKHKKQRGRAPSRVGKEGKRPLKLLLSGVQGGDLAECQFTSFGQQIKFTFSLQADTPDLLAENLMQAGHLQRDQKDEFCTLARSVIQQAKEQGREQVQKEAQTNTAKPLFALVEEGASERQEVVATFTAVDSSAALVQAVDKSDAHEPDQALVVKREGSANSSPPPQDHTVVVGQASAWKEAVVSKEDMTFPKEEAPHRAAGVPSRDSTPLTEEGLATKMGGTSPKASRTPLDDGAVTSKESGTPPKEGGTPPKEGGAPPKDDVTPPKEGETPPKEGRTPPKEGGAPPKDDVTPPKEGETPPKEGRTPPKEGGTPPKELPVHYNNPVLLPSSQSSTDSSAVSTPSEPVKTVGDCTAESEQGLLVHPRPLASLVQGPVLDSAHPSSSFHMVDSVPAVVAAPPPFAPDLQPSHSASVTPAVVTTLAPGIVPSTSAPSHAMTAPPRDDSMLHQRMPSDQFQSALPPTHPSPYYPHHTWMGPAYHNPYPPNPWTSYMGAYQTQHTLPVQLPPVPLPQAPPSQPVRLPHRGSLPTGQPSAKTFVVETVSEPGSLQPSAKEEVTGQRRPFVVESIPEWELEGSRLAAGVESRVDPPSLASLDECQVVDDSELQATCEDKSLVTTSEAEVGQMRRKHGLPFDPKDLDLQVMDGALGMMMYSMLQVLKNPRMAQLMNELERRYSGNSAAPHSSGRQSPKTDQTSISSSPQYLQRDEGSTLQAPQNSEPDKGLEALRRAMQQERQMLERQQEERLQEYNRRKASATLIPGAGQSERRAGSPLMSRSERHLKPALEEASRQGSSHSLQSLVVPTAHQQPPYVASRDSHRPHLSHGQVLGTVQYPAFPQGGGHGGPVWQEGATEGVPPQLQSHHRLPPALSWGAPSYPLPPQHGTLPHASWVTDKQHGSTLNASWPADQHGTAPHVSWPTDQQHGTAPHASWPTDQQHGTAPHVSWPADQQHGTAPHVSWPADQQHGTAPHVSWPADQQHVTAPHASWTTDQQHGTAPHASWTTDQQHGTAPHVSWPTDQQHGTAPHASWTTDQQHGTAPHASWTTDQQHGTAPHASWPADQQHGTAPHASWPADQQHGTAPHASWPADQQHGTAPHASWPADHFPHVHGKQ